MNSQALSIATKVNPLFESLPIDVVYLYGSVACAKADALSDYDFGILFTQELSSKKRFRLRLQLFGDLAEKLKVSEELLDVIDLEEVPLLLQFNVISGKIIYCINEARRLTFEIHVMARYHDEHYYLERNLLTTLEKIKKGVYFERRISYP